MNSAHIRKALDESGNTKYWVADSNGATVSDDFTSYGDALDFQHGLGYAVRPQMKVTIEVDGNQYESVGDLHAGDHLWVKSFTNMLSVLRGSSNIEPRYFERVVKEEETNE